MTNVPVMVDAEGRHPTHPARRRGMLRGHQATLHQRRRLVQCQHPHPFENPTPLTNFLELLAIIVVPMAQVYMFGLLVGNQKHAWCLFNVMLALFVLSFFIAWHYESQPNPVTTAMLPNMEGKEQRIGVMNSVLWGSACTAIDNGSVNSMHDSWMPLAGMMPMWNIMIGEMLFGGIGCGMYCMLFHVLITVFIAGLMIGRTPDTSAKSSMPGAPPGPSLAFSSPTPPAFFLPPSPSWSPRASPASATMAPWADRNPLLLRRGRQQQRQRLRRP